MFCYYPVTLLFLQVSIILTLILIPQLMRDHEMETPFAGVPFCPTHLSIQINSSTPILMFLKAQTLINK